MRMLKKLKAEISGLQKYKWFCLCLKPYRFLQFIKVFSRSILSKELSGNIDNYISSTLNNQERLRIYCDILCANIRHGATIINYFTYDFYNKSLSERREFITVETSLRFLHAFNPSKYHDIFRNKDQTYEIFKNYFGREIILVTESTEFGVFKEFCLKNHELFIKPRNLGFGRGTRRIQIDESTNLENLFHECLDEQLIIEEVINQHPGLAAFHPSSVNTIRVSTVVTKNGVRLMKPSFFKMGKSGSVNDNWSSGGILAEIDINTGIIYTNGSDVNLKQYAKHPDSNQQIKGYQIPFWNDLKEFASELALVVPQNRYVGWDIALNSKNKPILVEGNHFGFFYTFTFPGNRKMYEEALKDI